MTLVMGSCCGRFCDAKNKNKNKFKKEDIEEEGEGCYDYKNLNDLDEETRIEFGPLYMINEEKSDINTLDIKRRYRHAIESVYF
ncbi:CPXV054 protein [Cowpox virus]|uniref:Protein OPG051 n=1 Tax=Cowpox virus TaxID=10243 RepID=U5TGJ5_COWPX|nr:CPXV054 protein [Cowpox virus]AGY98496.1 CPXV054 protein [Cowpox virus]AGY98712.1 CPXV054 protein [Cowpox virus]AGY99142.1 CPXV054 protein [Cowpox virus]AGY99985.1 CPXV054 protein [Cowpox virus]